MIDDLASSGPGAGHRRRSVVFITAIILLALIAIVGTWGRQQEPVAEPLPPSAAASSSAAGQDPTAKYAGKAACLECHPGESALQARSGHARTLSPAEHSPIIAWLNGKSVTDPKYPDVQWSYHVRDNKLVVDRTADGHTESSILDYALGSGKHGVTFVSIQPGQTEMTTSGIEHRVSYLANSPRLALTPGQEGSPPAEQHHGEMARNARFGRPLNADRLRGCLGCHTTLVSPVIRPRSAGDSTLPNVTCERCHGPGRDHVEAARRGETDLIMRLGPDRNPPWVEVNLCGECHRVPRSVSDASITPENTGIVRFQGVGIATSACYQKGEGGLRCTTCHDPHDRASRDHAHYEAACLSCHQPGVAPKACPVSPRADCIACHMPRRNVPGNGIFTDHWIRKPTSVRSSTPKGDRRAKASASRSSPLKPSHKIL